ncbi:MAG: type II secretion system protein J, partial [Sulfitobacter sp.]
MHRSNGFTLLEVLVAMAIFSVVGLGANQMLRTVIDTHQKTKVQIK